MVLWTFRIVFWTRTFRCDVSSRGTLVAVITSYYTRTLFLPREKQFEIRPKRRGALSGLDIESLPVSVLTALYRAVVSATRSAGC